MRKVFVIQLIYPNPFSEEPVRAYLPEKSGLVVFNPCDAWHFNSYEEAEQLIVNNKAGKSIGVSLEQISLHIQKLFIHEKSANS